MNGNCYPIYRHSGKFGIHGPLLAILAAAIVGYPLGFVYVYAIKWISFIYANVFITAFYAFAVGLIPAMLLKFGKVRNNTVALLTGIVAAVIGWYLNWNAYLHIMTSDAPILATPSQIISAMKYFYEHGAWKVGRVFGEHSTITGIPLATVWVVEATIIIALGGIVGWSNVYQTPFCETHGCWLDQEKTFDKLDVFSTPDDIAALKAGNLDPLEHAQPRVPASGRFARVTLRHSPKCDDYCAFSIAHVTITHDKKGEKRETTQKIITNLWVPKTMYNYLAQFDHATAKPLTAA